MYTDDKNVGSGLHLCPHVQLTAFYLLFDLTKWGEYIYSKCVCVNVLVMHRKCLNIERQKSYGDYGHYP